MGTYVTHSEGAPSRDTATCNWAWAIAGGVQETDTATGPRGPLARWKENTENKGTHAEGKEIVRGGAASQPCWTKIYLAGEEVESGNFSGAEKWGPGPLPAKSETAVGEKSPWFLGAQSPSGAIHKTGGKRSPQEYGSREGPTNQTHREPPSRGPAPAPGTSRKKRGLSGCVVRAPMANTEGKAQTRTNTLQLWNW